MVIGILGGGASGMAAALAAAENPENQVILMERQSRVGKKLSATGNGRCNLTNLHVSPAHYHGQQPEFAQYALSVFDAQAAQELFSGLGLLTVAEDSASSCLVWRASSSSSGRSSMVTNRAVSA